MRRVLRRLPALLLALPLPAPLLAQNSCPANYATVTVSTLGAITRLPSGRLTVLAHDAAGNQVNYAVPGVGVELMKAKICTIAQGALVSCAGPNNTTVPYLCLARTDRISTPVAYHFIARDTSAIGGNGIVLDVDNVGIKADTFDLGDYTYPDVNPFTEYDITLGAVAATVDIGQTETLPAGSQAQVLNDGTNKAAVLHFKLPQGAAGANGTPATVAVGQVDTLPAGSQAQVLNDGTSSAAVLHFKLPQGAAGTGGNGSANIAGTQYHFGLINNSTGNAIGDGPITVATDGSAVQVIRPLSGQHNTLDGGHGESTQSCPFFAASGLPQYCGNRSFLSALSGYDRFPGNQAGVYAWNDGYNSYGTGIRGSHTEVSNYYGRAGDINDHDRALAVAAAATDPADEDIHADRNQIFEVSPAYGHVAQGPGGAPNGVNLFDQTETVTTSTTGTAGCAIDLSNGQPFCGTGLYFSNLVATDYIATHGTASFWRNFDIDACYPPADNCTGAPNGYGLAFFDKFKNFLGAYHGNRTPNYQLVDNPITLPAGTAYVRFAYRNGGFDLSSAMMLAGGVSSGTYVPYSLAAFTTTPLGQDVTVTFSEALGTLGTGGPLLNLSSRFDLNVQSVAGNTLNVSNTLTPSTNGTLASAVAVPAGTQDSDGFVATFNVNTASDPAGKTFAISGSSPVEVTVPISTTSVSTGVYAVTARLRFEHNAGDAFNVGGLVGSVFQLEAGTPPTLQNGSPNLHTVWVLGNTATAVLTGYTSYGATATGYLSTGTHPTYGAAMIWDVRNANAGNAVDGHYAQIAANNVSWNANDLAYEGVAPNEVFDLYHDLYSFPNPYATYNIHTIAGIGDTVGISGHIFDIGLPAGSRMADFSNSGGFGAGILSGTAPLGAPALNACANVPAMLCVGRTQSTDQYWIFATGFDNYQANGGFNGISVNGTTGRLHQMATDFDKPMTVTEDAQATCDNATGVNCGEFGAAYLLTGPTPDAAGFAAFDSVVSAATYYGAVKYLHGPAMANGTYTDGGAITGPYTLVGSPDQSLKNIWAIDTMGHGLKVVNQTQTDITTAWTFGTDGSFTLGYGDLVLPNSAHDGHHYKLQIDPTTSAVTAVLIN